MRGNFVSSRSPFHNASIYEASRWYIIIVAINGSYCYGIDAWKRGDYARCVTEITKIWNCPVYEITPVYLIRVPQALSFIAWERGIVIVAS